MYLIARNERTPSGAIVFWRGWARDWVENPRDGSLYVQQDAQLVIEGDLAGVGVSLVERGLAIARYNEFPT